MADLFKLFYIFCYPIKRFLDIYKTFEVYCSVSSACEIKCLFIFMSAVLFNFLGTDQLQLYIRLLSFFPLSSQILSLICHSTDSAWRQSRSGNAGLKTFSSRDTSDSSGDLTAVFQLSLSMRNWVCHFPRHLTKQI